MARLVFLGTPEAAVPPLRTLVEAGHEMVLVVTRADKRRGRGSGVRPSPVKAAALELGLEVTDTLDDVRTVGAELGVVVAYGRIIPVSVLEHLPMVNLHFSLLPRWRGAAPVERAILEGDVETGVCLMAVEAGLDTGGIYAQADTVIGPEETADHLRSRLVDSGCRLLEEHLVGGVAGLPQPRDQRGTPSYAEKILPSDRELHWEQPAIETLRVIRIGRAWTLFRGRRLGVVTATEVLPGADPDGDRVSGSTGSTGSAGSTGPGAQAATAPGSLVGTTVATGSAARLRLITVKPEGKRPMDAGDWLRGTRPEAHEQMGV